MGPIGERKQAVRDAAKELREARKAWASDPHDSANQQRLTEAQQRFADAQRELSSYRANSVQAQALVASAPVDDEPAPVLPAAPPVVNNVVESPPAVQHHVVPPVQESPPTSREGGGMKTLGAFLAGCLVVLAAAIIYLNWPNGRPVSVAVNPTPTAAATPVANTRVYGLGDRYTHDDGRTGTVLAVTDNGLLIDWDDNGNDAAGQSPTPPASEAPTQEPATEEPEQPQPTDQPSTGEMPPLPVNICGDNSWEVHANEGIDNDPIVRDWLCRLKDPAPERWPTFPNIPNPEVRNWDVANGMEYGVADVPFCAQDERCDFPVPGWHYRLITADYDFMGMSCDSSEVETGCMLVLINVGEETYTWRDQIADAGFSVPGRYWNGDKLDEGVWGLVSHASANMLNMETSAHPDESLNFGSAGANAGANCGQVDGCDSVHIRVVVHAVDRILAVAQTTVSR